MAVATALGGFAAPESLGQEGRRFAGWGPSTKGSTACPACGIKIQGQALARKGVNKRRKGGVLLCFIRLVTLLPYTGRAVCWTGIPPPSNGEEC